VLWVWRLRVNRFQLTATDMFAAPDRQPGNLGFDPLSLSTPENRAKYELAEVTHGRAAMMGKHLCQLALALVTLGLAWSTRSLAPRRCRREDMVEGIATGPPTLHVRVRGCALRDSFVLTPLMSVCVCLPLLTHPPATGFSGIIHQMIVTKQATIEQMMNFKSVDPAAFKGLSALVSNP